MSHPYSSLPPEGFWKTAVSEKSPFEVCNLWTPKFPITRKTQIVTAGSCFAQHFSRALVARGYSWLDTEPGPAGLNPQQRHDYHYGVFSFRTGNIYTPRMLRQGLEWAIADVPPPEEIWETEGRFFDPFRPAVEPGGFASAEELHLSRAQTLAAIRRAVTEADVFVFSRVMQHGVEVDVVDLGHRHDVA
ncbi:MAG: GSCFA domain-containing protein, partial [Rhodobacteraceae bacterium]|nr:GSCFA domain-containing protein [Paracoccaceae bacterium]